jgi:hypothetical protein
MESQGSGIPHSESHTLSEDMQIEIRDTTTAGVDVVAKKQEDSSLFRLLVSDSRASKLARTMQTSFQDLATRLESSSSAMFARCGQCVKKSPRRCSLWSVTQVFRQPSLSSAPPRAGLFLQRVLVPLLRTEASLHNGNRLLLLASPESAQSLL